jgi:hypothetical protein
MDFRDLNKACPKDDLPTPFFNHILGECIGSGIFSFMDGSSGYNYISIQLKYHHKTTFICPWGTFAYKNIPFGLKNVGTTFLWAMMFDFDDLKNMVEDYLDDLIAHSRKRA